MEEVVKEIGKDIFSIKEQLKSLSKLEAIEKELADLKSLLSSKNTELSPSLIDEIVKHSTSCPACRKALQDALNKYYEVLNFGGKSKGSRRSKAGK